MLEFSQIVSSSDPYFDACWSLYNSAFPIEERRDLDYHLEAMTRSAFKFNALLDNGVLVGFFSFWDIDNFFYLEHLAIEENFRNGGYGKKVLALLQSLTKKTIILEVEHPSDDIKKRRIGFYERNGFLLNDYVYNQPPYSGEQYVSLLLMTYPRLVDKMEFDSFVKDSLPIVHFRL